MRDKSAALALVQGDGRSPLPSYNSMTASAKVIFPVKSMAPKYVDWQQQGWTYFDTLGEFEFGINWLANTISRVRLVAAIVRDNGTEPELLDTGPAAELVARLAGGLGGQARLMHQFTTHLSVPGECWLLGEQPDSSVNKLEEECWGVKSADELRLSKRRIDGEQRYEIRNEEEDKWRPISKESLVVRVWNAHPRFGWQADSPTRHALGALFELDAVNKRIIAQVLSRLATNGILLYDKQRLSIPSRKGNAGPEEVDPFAQILVEVAGRGIADPASPEATIPIPIGYQIDDLTNVDPKMLMQWIKLSDGIDEKLLAQRESALRRSATSLDLPAELILGMGDMNHWGAFQIEESALKVHVMPKCELIAYSLTTGYLHPMLKAAGQEITQDGGRLIVWYDPSDIVTRPDKSSNVMDAYDRFEVGGDTLRREIGLGEEDKPEKTELVLMALKMLIRTNPGIAAAALAEMGGPKLEAPAPPPGRPITINRPGDAPPVGDAPATDPEKDDAQEPDDRPAPKPAR